MNWREQSVSICVTMRDVEVLVTSQIKKYLTPDYYNYCVGAPLFFKSEFLVGYYSHNILTFFAQNVTTWFSKSHFNIFPTVALILCHSKLTLCQTRLKCQDACLQAWVLAARTIWLANDRKLFFCGMFAFVFVCFVWWTCLVCSTFDWSRWFRPVWVQGCWSFSGQRCHRHSYRHCLHHLLCPLSHVWLPSQVSIYNSYNASLLLIHENSYKSRLVFSVRAHTHTQTHICTLTNTHIHICVWVQNSCKTHSASLISIIWC